MTLRASYPRPPFPAQPQAMPGHNGGMQPLPDYGESSYRGAGRLDGLKAIVTGGDSGIGRAVALAYAREGADVLISYLDEHEDADETRRLVESSGRTAVLIPGDIRSAAHCRAIVESAAQAFGRIDILVNNAAHQATFAALEDISDEEWDHTFRTNVHAMFYLAKAVVPHMVDGGSIINTASINADAPNPTLLAYATTKGAIQNFTAGLAQLLAERNIRVNAVAPGPIWTPLIPSTMDADAVRHFGHQVPMKRPGQPAGAGDGVRDAGRSAVELRVGRDDRGDRWKTDALGATRAQRVELLLEHAHPAQQRQRDREAVVVEFEVFAQPPHPSHEDHALGRVRVGRGQGAVRDERLDEFQRQARQRREVARRVVAARLDPVCFDGLEGHRHPPFVKRARGSELDASFSCSYSERSAASGVDGTSMRTTAYRSPGSPFARGRPRFDRRSRRPAVVPGGMFILDRAAQRRYLDGRAEHRFPRRERQVERQVAARHAIERMRRDGQHEVEVAVRAAALPRSTLARQTQTLPVLGALRNADAKGLVHAMRHAVVADLGHREFDVDFGARVDLLERDRRADFEVLARPRRLSRPPTTAAAAARRRRTGPRDRRPGSSRRRRHRTNRRTTARSAAPSRAAA